MEGAHLRVTWLSPYVFRHFNPSMWQDVAVYSIRQHLSEEDPDFAACVKRMCEEKADVYFVQKFYGLTHPQFPFPCARRSIPILDEETQEGIKQAVEAQVGYDSTAAFNPQDNKWLRLMTGHIAPFTFPPMLSDADRRMAENLVVSEAPFASEDEAESYFAPRNSVRWASRRQALLMV